jgi:hypothetical protein
MIKITEHKLVTTKKEKKEAKETDQQENKENESPVEIREEVEEKQTEGTNENAFTQTDLQIRLTTKEVPPEDLEALKIAIEIECDEENVSEEILVNILQMAKKKGIDVEEKVMEDGSTFIRAMTKLYESFRMAQLRQLAWKKAEEEKKKAEEEAKKKEEETLKKENETLKTEEKAERDDAKAMARAIREKIEAQLAEQFPIEPVKTSSKPKSAATEDTEAPSNSENKAKEGGDKEAGEAQQEDDDSHGTKKMKSDFDAKMIAMEQEMSAGRSKLAKLRERIRKAKGVVKEADTALDDSKKS